MVLVWQNMQMINSYNNNITIMMLKNTIKCNLEAYALKTSIRGVIFQTILAIKDSINALLPYCIFRQ